MGLAFTASHAQRTGQMLIQGQECKYDTLLSRNIAPGATYTQFLFKEIKMGNYTYKMKTHLITIDNTNPHNHLATYLSKGDYFVASNQKKEVERQKGLGLKPVASIDGACFTQSNLVTNTTRNYEMIGSFITDNEVRYGDDKLRLNYAVDNDNIGRILASRFQGEVTAEAGTFGIAQLNHSRYFAGEKLALFCNGVTKTNAGTSTDGKEVVLEKVGEGNFVVGDNKCKVLRKLKGSDNVLAKNEAILSGAGAAEEFLDALQIDEEINIRLSHMDAEGNLIETSQIMAAMGDSPYVRQGEVIPIELRNTAQAGMGVSQDGKTTYLAQMEISSSSNAPAICFAEFLRATGSWDAIKLDGGPSAEITVDGDFVTTSSVGSGFNGRLIPAGLMLYSTAPNDNVVKYLETDNSNPQSLRRGESFTLKVYAYNQYGEMIDKDIASKGGIYFTCTDGLGDVYRSTFTAQRGGEGYIEARIVGNDDYVLRIPIKVTDDRVLKVSPKTFFTGEGRTCQATLQCVANGTSTTIDPALAQWTSTNTYAVKSCEGGLIVPYVDGFAEVCVEYDGLKDTLKVTVENLEEEVATLDLTSQLTDPTKPALHLPSVPRSIEGTLSLSPAAAGKATLRYQTGDQEHTLEVEVGEEGTAQFTLSFDYDDPYTYPITLLEVSAAEGQTATLDKLVAVYSLETGIATMPDTMGGSRDKVFNMLGQQTRKMSKGIYIIGGRKAVVK